MGFGDLGFLGDSRFLGYGLWNLGIQDLKVWDLGLLGFGDLGFLGFGDLRILGFEVFGVWGFGVLGVQGLRFRV